MQKKFLIKKYYLVLDKYYYGYTNFSIQIYNILKLLLLYLYSSNKYRKRYPIRVNSFISIFPIVRLDAYSRIIKIFICLKFNISKVIKYLRNK